MKLLLRKTLLLTLSLTASLVLWARPYTGSVHKMTQPNGEAVNVLLYGDEFHIDAESPDGYTVVVDDSTGYVCYASLTDDGRDYKSTGIVYNGSPIPDLVKQVLTPHIRISSESAAEKRAAMRERLHTEKVSTSAKLKATSALPDTVYGVCVLINFTDVKSSVSREVFEQFLNGDNNPIHGNSMSVKEYFQWISGGKLTYINYVPASFYTTEREKSYYSPADATDYTTDLLFPEVRKALQSYTIAKDGFDISKLTVRNGAICAINIYYAGDAPQTWATGLWPHQGYFEMDCSSYNHEILPWNWQPYQMSDISTELKLGTIVHENGHLVCGWPDFYCYDCTETQDNNSLVYNIGDAFNIYDEKAPTYPNPWALDEMGWLSNRIDITDKTGGELVTLSEGPGNAAVFNGQNNTYYEEKYYLEVRDGFQTQDWEKVNVQGIFIWHYNENGDNTTSTNQYELLDCRPANSYNPMWYKGNGPDVFCDSLSPSATWANGVASGAYLWDFSAGGKTMTFRCGKPASTLAEEVGQSQPYTLYNMGDGFVISTAEETTVRIFAISGKAVEKFELNGGEERFFGNEYDKGVYLIKVSDTQHTETIKIIK